MIGTASLVLAIMLLLYAGQDFDRAEEWEHASPEYRSFAMQLGQPVDDDLTRRAAAATILAGTCMAFCALIAFRLRWAGFAYAAVLGVPAALFLAGRFVSLPDALQLVASPLSAGGGPNLMLAVLMGWTLHALWRAHVIGALGNAPDPLPDVFA